jgi:hypothetical protein
VELHSNLAAGIAVAEPFFGSLKKERIKKISTKHALSRSKTFPTISKPSAIEHAGTRTWAEQGARPGASSSKPRRRR